MILLDMHQQRTDRAVSPVVAVILMVAITVILSAVIGAFVFDLGQSTTDGQAQQELGVRSTQTDGTYTAQVVTGEADELQIQVGGSVEANLSNPSPGDEVSVIAAEGETITVVSVRDGEKRIVQKQSSTTAVTAPTDGLVAHWTFDEGSGATASDSAGSYDASLTNTTWSSGHVGPHALSFPESDSHGHTPDADALEGDGGHTAAAWVKPSTLESQDVLSKWNQSNGDRNWLLMVKYDGSELRVRGHVGNGSAQMDYTVIDSTESFASGTWVHVAQTWDGSTLTLYLNGEPVGSTTSSYTIKNTPSDVYIGDREADGAARETQSWTGDIDDARYYGRALSETEMERLYDATK